jgi:hypothetical protein
MRYSALVFGNLYDGMVSFLFLGVAWDFAWKMVLWRMIRLVLVFARGYGSLDGFAYFWLGELTGIAAQPLPSLHDDQR